MTSTIKSIPLIVLLILLLFFPNHVKSQIDTSKTSIEQDSNQENYSSAILNVSYTNNNIEYLTGESENIPSLFSSISYFHKSGVYGGFGYANYFGDQTTSYDYDIAAGYQKYFKNGFDFDLSYTWHKYSGDTILEGFNYDHAINFILAYDINNFYFTADLTYYLGETKNYAFDLNFSRFFTINKILFKNDALYISPSLALSFGTDFWLYEGLSGSEKTSLLSSLKQSGYSYETFSYESFNFYLPISYGIKNTYITFSWLYTIPSKKYEYIGWQKQSGFMLSLSYFLDFSEK
ncbi:MAG: hypothetical protein JEY96_03080 [Bacteroidales bacterium]|nr:hypothetical protein [Bacteroidales bacterium]